MADDIKNKSMITVIDIETKKCRCCKKPKKDDDFISPKTGKTIATCTTCFANYDTGAPVFWTPERKRQLKRLGATMNFKQIAKHLGQPEAKVVSALYRYKISFVRIRTGPKERSQQLSQKEFKWEDVVKNNKDNIFYQTWV